MTIDWFTFTAQILNFLVLVWLMKRFLYGPIVEAMEQRETRISERLQSAEGAEKDALAARRDFEQKSADLDRASETLLLNAHREVDAWRVEHLQQARDEVDTARVGWRTSLERERQTLLRELQLEVAHHSSDVARRLLTELADERLQNRLVTRFLERLATADAATHKLISESQRERPVIVESSHELSPSEQEVVCVAVRQVTKLDGEVDFRINPDLVCGIELHAGGCKLAWSIREALAELESSLIDAIEAVVPSTATVDASDAASPAIQETRT